MPTLNFSRQQITIGTSTRASQSFGEVILQAQQKARKLLPPKNNSSNGEVDKASRSSATTYPDPNLVYGRTEDALSTTVGAKEPVGSGNGNAHRARLQADLQGTSLSLMDTYERDYSQTRPSNDARPNITKAGLKMKSTRSCLTPPVQKPIEKKRNNRGKATQDRPWPPPALVGTPSFCPQLESPQAHRASKPKTTSAVIESSKSNLADPKDFMSYFNSLNAPNTAKPTAAQDKGSSPAEAKHSSPEKVTFSAPAKAKSFSPAQVEYSPTAHAVIKASPPAPTFKPQETVMHALTASASHNEIRKVPVEEFSFPLSNALAPGEVATHTDGAPSPATLSGFSDSGSVIGNCAGTRASSVATKSPFPPNIMDSPILDDVSGIAVMKGQEWVPKSQFIALQAEFEATKKELAGLKLQQSLATVAATPRVSFSIPDAKANHPASASELKHGRQSRSENVSLTTSIFAPLASPAKQLGLGISIAQLQAAPKPSMKSPDHVSAVLKPISTNGGSIFGDSKVIRPASRHVTTASTDLLTRPTVKKAPKPLIRGPAGPGFNQLLKDLGALPSGGQDVPSQSGLQFINNRYAQRGPELESDEEL